MQRSSVVIPYHERSCHDDDDEDNVLIPRSPSSKALAPYLPKTEAEDLTLQELVNYCKYLGTLFIGLLIFHRRHFRNRKNRHVPWSTQRMVSIHSHQRCLLPRRDWKHSIPPRLQAECRSRQCRLFLSPWRSNLSSQQSYL